jgi:hypothetical protein
MSIGSQLGELIATSLIFGPALGVVVSFAEVKGLAKKVKV